MFGGQPSTNSFFISFWVLLNRFFYFPMSGRSIFLMISIFNEYSDKITKLTLQLSIL